MGIADFHDISVETIFAPRTFVATSPYIKSMHPKTEIKSDSSAISRILEMGWVGQLKIHGHRAQIHIPLELDAALIAYTRQGKHHTVVLPEPMQRELRRLFQPKSGWNVIDAEWLKGEAKLYVFDFLKKDGELLRGKTYPERWSLLPRAFISPHIVVLPLLSDVASCRKAIDTTGPEVEGLVFKSSTSTGFSDTSIVRCRKRK